MINTALGSRKAFTAAKLLFKLFANKINRRRFYLNLQKCKYTARYHTVSLFSRRKGNAINSVDWDVAVTNGVHSLSSRFPLTIMRPKILFVGPASSFYLIEVPVSS